jgi:hypothetical protein
MPYADKDQLIADYIPEAKSQAEKDAIGHILAAVGAFVDTYCKRTAGYFNPAAEEATEKRVRGEGERFLRLPVHVFGSVGEVKTSYGSLIDSSNYYESDKNGWLYGENDGLYPQAAFDLCSPDVWTDGAIFKVKARWGYAATPADLVEAVRLTVLRIWETQKGTLGQITPGAFVVERALAPFAKEVLDRYKRREFEI